MVSLLAASAAKVAILEKEVIEEDPDERILWTYTAFTVDDRRRAWYEEDEKQDPNDYVTDDENLSSLVKNIYYRGRLIWTRDRQCQPWKKHLPLPSSSEDPLW